MGGRLDRLLALAARALPLTIGLLLAALGRRLELEPLAAVGLVLVAALAGDALVPRSARAALTLLERGVVAFVAGLVALGGVGLLLADLGIWRAWAIVALAIALAGAGLARDLRGAAPAPAPDDAPPPAWRREDAVLVVLALVVVALAWPAFEWVIGGRDPGLYDSAAYAIGDRGDIAIDDPALPVGSPALTPETRMGARLMGYYASYPQYDQRRITPHGFHLLPATMAAAGIASGQPDGRLVLPLVGVAALLGSALVARRLAPRRAPPVIAVVALVVLATCFAMYWFIRYPSTEPLSLACLMAGTLLLRAGLPGAAGARGGPLLVGGALLGAQLLARPDAIVVAPAVALAVAWWIAAGRPVRPVLLALAGAVLTLGAGALHAWRIARWYTEGVFGRFDLVAPALGLVALAAVALLAGALARRRLPALLAGEPRRRALVGAAAAIVPVLGLAALAFAGSWLGGTWLRLYVTWPTIALALVGAGVVGAVALARDRLGFQAPLLAIGLAAALVYLRDPQIFPDQPWAARRFVPVIIPLVVALAAVALGSAPLALRGRARLAAAVCALAVAAAIGVRLSADTQIAVGFVEYDGAVGVVDTLDERLGDPSTLVFIGAHEVAANRFGTALAVRHHRIAIPFRGRLDGPLVAAVIERELARRPIMVLEYGRERPTLPAGYEARRVGSIAFTLPEMERPKGFLPNAIGHVRGAFNLYRVVRAGA